MCQALSSKVLPFLNFTCMRLLTTLSNSNQFSFSFSLFYETNILKVTLLWFIVYDLLAHLMTRTRSWATKQNTVCHAARVTSPALNGAGNVENQTQCQSHFVVFLVHLKLKLFQFLAWCLLICCYVSHAQISWVSLWKSLPKVSILYYFLLKKFRSNPVVKRKTAKVVTAKKGTLHSKTCFRPLRSGFPNFIRFRNFVSNKISKFIILLSDPSWVYWIKFSPSKLWHRQLKFSSTQDHILVAQI